MSSREDKKAARKAKKEKQKAILEGVELEEPKVEKKKAERSEYHEDEFDADDGDHDLDQFAVSQAGSEQSQQVGGNAMSVSARATRRFCLSREKWDEMTIGHHAASSDVHHRLFSSCPAVFASCADLPYTLPRLAFADRPGRCDQA